MSAKDDLTSVEALSEIAVQINNIRDEDELFARILDIAMETLDAERGFVLMAASDSNTGFEVRHRRNFSSDQLDDVMGLSSGVVARVIESREPILMHEALKHEEFGTNESILLHSVQSIACVPLVVKGKQVGVVYLDSITKRSRFDHDSLPFLRAFAHQAGIAIENAQLYRVLSDENRNLRAELTRAAGFPKIIGKSTAMADLFDLVSRVAQSDATVLIEGESGTGKELVARAIHDNGPRRSKPFIALFCGSIPNDLIASELFGHKKGAFTGATSDKAGLFEAAHGGTVFLDEVAELTQPMQVSLLRVLQEGEVRRVGDTRSRAIDVRVVSATNTPLGDLIESGRFREDLYYRLNTIPIRTPPLRERRTDVPLLAHFFLDRIQGGNEARLKGFTEEAMALMERYPWPGNVRELENTIERASVLATGALISAGDLRLPESDLLPEIAAGTTLKEIEKAATLRTLESCGNNVSEAARVLGVSRNWVHYKLKEWNAPKK